MNPFLQRHWGDVHTALIGFIREALSHDLPEDLAVRAEERISVLGDLPRDYRADVAILEPWRRGGTVSWDQSSASESGVVMAAPIVVFDEPGTERWLEIRDAHGYLITVIEVLSPTNKREDGWGIYRARQRELLGSGVTLVEIDLVRGGLHAAAVALDRFEHPPGTWHLICVSRAGSGRSGLREIYPCPLREPLPTIRVPLRPTDADVPLALQTLVDRCYETGRHWLDDVSGPLGPPVGEDEAEWIEERLVAMGMN